MDKNLTTEMPKTMYSELAPRPHLQYFWARLVNIELIGTGKTRDLLWTFSLNGPSLPLDIPLVKMSKYHTVEQREQLRQELSAAGIFCSVDIWDLTQELIGQTFLLEVLWDGNEPRVKFILPKNLL